MRYLNIKFILTIIILLSSINTIFAQKPYRSGSTVANFLEIGYGSAGVALGDAYVSMTNDVSGAYWNPAGLGFMNQHEAQFFYQPWLVDSKIEFAGVGVVLPTVGTIGLSLLHIGYGEMEVTTMTYQDGTGELFNANEYAVALSYGHRLTPSFSFGASFKYVASQIWSLSASAIAVDLGVLLKTQFFAPTGRMQDGLAIGMSISNYGTRMRYDGLDLLNPIDILPNEDGNYQNTPGQFRLNEWELPLIFRVGISLNPIATEKQRITLSADALHPNNNSEYLNAGAQYSLDILTFGTLFLRGGYKGLFMYNSEYGYTFGFGVAIKHLRNNRVQFDYAFREMGVFGGFNCFDIKIIF